MLRIEIPEDAQTPVYRRIAQAVRDAVATGRFAPGDKLPTQSTLAKQLGVNTLTVSRGYALLESEGIITQRQGSGTYVQSDALRSAGQSGKRRYDALFLVLGMNSLARASRETQFIYTDLLGGVTDVLGPRQTHLIFVEAFNRQSLADIKDTDAVLFLGTCEKEMSLLGELARRIPGGIPVIDVWESHLESPAVPLVGYDRQQSAALACRHLLDCGYRRIGFIGKKHRYGSQALSPKFTAFMGAMHDAGLDILARDVRDIGHPRERAYAEMRDILLAGDVPDAFFVDTDYRAMEVIGAIEDAGLKVPDDIGVVSYDDIPEAAWFTPALTTVRVPRHELGQQVARMLQDWTADGPPPTPTPPPSELMIRQSTRAATSAPAGVATKA